MIIAQKPTQSLAAPHWPLALPIRRPRKQQNVTLPLMIPLGMQMVDIVAQRPPQRALAEQDHLGQTLLLDRSDPAPPHKHSGSGCAQAARALQPDLTQ